MSLTTVDQGLLGPQAQYTSFKNRIINGVFGVWQRGTSFSSVGYGTYTADRWASGANTMTITRNTDVPNAAFQYSLDMQQTSVDYGSIFHRIEAANSYDLSGQNATISFWAKSISGAQTLNVTLSYANTADNFSAITTISSQSITLTSSWAYYTATFTGLPSGVANGLQLALFRGNSATSQTRLAGVQLEKGTTATSFDYRPYGTELQLCQRYFELLGSAVGRSSSTTNMDLVFPYKVDKRSTPTITLFNGTSAVNQLGRSAANINSIATQWAVSTVSCGISVTTSDTGLTAGLVATTAANATVLSSSAEL